jgi:hypothetical protein
MSPLKALKLPEIVQKSRSFIVALEMHGRKRHSLPQGLQFSHFQPRHKVPGHHQPVKLQLITEECYFMQILKHIYHLSFGFAGEDLMGES